MYTEEFPSKNKRMCRSECIHGHTHANTCAGLHLLEVNTASNHDCIQLRCSYLKSYKWGKLSEETKLLVPMYYFPLPALTFSYSLSLCIQN